VNTRAPLLALSLSLLLTGCQSRGVGAAESRAQLDTQREQLDMIPPPAKSRFMSIRNFDNWENPYLTVQSGMFELHVTLADPNPSPIGAGGMLRPVGARRQELNIDLPRLGEAISSIPQSSWPYGRVIAIEEAHKTPPSAEPAVRRNMEVAIARLTDLGIEVYDPSEGTLR
jgi:hypothetical protein